MSDAHPALEYLLACSDVSLQSFRISRMNQAANLRKQVWALVDEWVEAEVDAGLSRWLLECRHTDAVRSMLELDYLLQRKSLEHVTTSFRPGCVQLSTIAARQQRLSTDLVEVEDDGVCPSLEGALVIQGHTKGPRKPHTEPLAGRRLTSCPEEAGIVLVPVRSSSKAQHELEFELEGFHVSRVGTEEAPKATVSDAAVGESFSSTESLPQQANHSLAEAHAGQLTECPLLHEHALPHPSCSRHLSLRPGGEADGGHSVAHGDIPLSLIPSSE